MQWTLASPNTYFESMLAKVPVSEIGKNIVRNAHAGHTRLYHGKYHLAFIWATHQTLTKSHDISYAKVGDVRIASATAYHDIVYDAPSKTNEIDSANMWLGHAFAESSKIDPEMVGWVYEAIHATRNHAGKRPMVTQGDHLREWFVGLDLVGLAAPWDIFSMNNDLIRIEYNHISEDAYKTGRNAFMKTLLDDSIYRDPLLHKLFEQSARNNIEKLISG